MLTCGTLFFACRLEVVAVTRLRWLRRCVFDEAVIFSISSTSTQSISVRDPDSSQRRLGEGAPTVKPVCPPRTLAHLSPPGVTFSVLAPEKFGVIINSYLIKQQSCAHQRTKPTSLILKLSNLIFFSIFESACGYCSRRREPRQTPARGMSRHVFWPPRSRRGGAWVLCRLHHRRVG